MQILKSTFLYLLFALFVVGGVFAIAPSEAQAQANCTITNFEWPGPIYENETQGEYTMTGYCQDVPEDESYGNGWVVTGIRDLERNRWVAGTQTTWGTGYVYFSLSDSYEWAETGDKDIEARVNWNAGVHPSFYLTNGSDTDRRTIEVVTRSDALSMNSVNISGPSSLTLSGSSVSAQYNADFDYDGSSVRYYFHHDDQTKNQKSTSGTSGSDTLTFTETGTYQACVTAWAVGSNSISSTKTNCMNVSVNRDPNPIVYGCMDPDATNYDPNATEDDGSCVYDNDTVLRIVSSGASNVPVNIFNEGAYGPDGSTTLTNDLSGGVSEDSWIQVPSTHDGLSVQGWDGCDSTGDGGRSCLIEGISDGETKTLTVTYADGGSTDDDDDNNPPPSSDAVLRVYSTNPSSGAGMDVTVGSFGDFSTEETITRDSDINATIWARTPVDGNDFSDWDGCDSSVGRRCDVSVNTGQTQTITANYSGGGDPEEPTPSDKAVLNISSNGVSDVEIEHLSYALRQDGQQFFTTGSDYPVYYDNRVYDGGDPMWLVADPSHQGKVPTGWDGCDGVADGGRSCRITEISVGETLNLTVNYGEQEVEGCTDPDATNHDPDATVDDGSCTYPQPAVINNFNVSDPNLIPGNPPELHVDDQPFELIWSTENANSVEASGDWSGPRNLSDSQPQPSVEIDDNEETFSFTLTAYGDGGDDSETVEITLLDPPRFSLDSESETDIDGTPGSQATNEVTIDPHKYNGDIRLEVKEDDIPAELKDEEGASKIFFTFPSSPVDISGDDPVTATLNIDIVQPIYEDISVPITITGTDLNGDAEPQVQKTEFILNIDGFSPRTIEEF